MSATSIVSLSLPLRVFCRRKATPKSLSAAAAALRGRCRAGGEAAGAAEGGGGTAADLAVTAPAPEALAVGAGVVGRFLLMGMNEGCL